MRSAELPRVAHVVVAHTMIGRRKDKSGRFGWCEQQLPAPPVVKPAGGLSAVRYRTCAHIDLHENHRRARFLLQDTSSIQPSRLNTTKTYILKVRCAALSYSSRINLQTTRDPRRGFACPIHLPRSSVSRTSVSRSRHSSSCAPHGQKKSGSFA